MKKIEKVDRDFKRCHICEAVFNDIDGRASVNSCPNGCIRYDIYHLIELVKITLFNEKEFVVKLYDIVYDLSDDTRVDVEESELEYLKALNYWRKDDRYLIKIMERE